MVFHFVEKFSRWIIFKWLSFLIKFEKRAFFWKKDKLVKKIIYLTTLTDNKKYSMHQWRPYFTESIRDLTNGVSPCWNVFTVVRNNFKWLSFF